MATVSKRRKRVEYTPSEAEKLYPEVIKYYKSSTQKGTQRHFARLIPKRIVGMMIRAYEAGRPFEYKGRKRRLTVAELESWFPKVVDFYTSTNKGNYSKADTLNYFEAALSNTTVMRMLKAHEEGRVYSARPSKHKKYSARRAKKPGSGLDLVKAQVKTKMSMVREHLQKNPNIGVSQLAKLINIPDVTVRYYIKRLRQEGDGNGVCSERDLGASSDNNDDGGRGKGRESESENLELELDEFNSILEEDVVEIDEGGEVSERSDVTDDDDDDHDQLNKEVESDWSIPDSSDSEGNGRVDGNESGWSIPDSESEPETTRGSEKDNPPDEDKPLPQSRTRNRKRKVLSSVHSPSSESKTRGGKRKRKVIVADEDEDDDSHQDNDSDWSITGSESSSESVSNTESKGAEESDDSPGVHTRSRKRKGKASSPTKRSRSTSNNARKGKSPSSSSRRPKKPGTITPLPPLPPLPPPPPPLPPISPVSPKEDRKSGFECPTCPALGQMDVHFFVAHLVFHGKYPIKCTECHWHLMENHEVIERHWNEFHGALPTPTSKYVRVTLGPVKMWRCVDEECSEIFATFDDRDAHEQAVHGASCVPEDLTSSCSVCSLKLRTLDEVRLHKALEHPAEAALDCSFCDQTFEARSHEDTPFRQLDQMRNHIFEKHPDMNRSFRHWPKSSKKDKEEEEGGRRFVYTLQDCPLCGLIIHSCRCVKLDQHLTQGHGLPFHRNYTCPICIAEMKYGDSWDHMRKQHWPDVPKEFVCQYCGKKCSTKKERKVHELAHDIKERRADPFVCELCGKEYSLRSSLCLHRQIKHGTGKGKGNASSSTNVGGVKRGRKPKSKSDKEIR